MAQWEKLSCSRRKLRLDLVLPCGQSFRWHENENGEWLGVMANRVWRLKQDETCVYFQVYGGPKEEQTNETTFVKSKAKTDSNIGCQKVKLEPVEIKAEPSDIKSEESGICGKEKLTLKTVKAEFLDDAKFNECGDVAVKTELLYGGATSAVSILEDYFQLDIDLDSLYSRWCKDDPYFRKTAAEFWGIRQLRQDPVENLFSMICATNNRISRISGMVEKLCATYGEPITEVDGKVYHSFPRVASLAEEGVEETLRELGFGYRSEYVVQSAKFIMDHQGEDWVMALRQMSYTEARAQLLQLSGVGRKVADCVCLMSLDKTEAVPVDTHVFQFAARNYLHELESAKLSDRRYQEIADHLRKLWGPYAGWAQTVMYASELRQTQSKKLSSPVKVDPQ